MLEKRSDAGMGDRGGAGSTLRSRHGVGLESVRRGGGWWALITATSNEVPTTF